jgi:hypothetical protein
MRSPPLSTPLLDRRESVEDSLLLESSLSLAPSVLLLEDRLGKNTSSSSLASCSRFQLCLRYVGSSPSSSLLEVSWLACRCLLTRATSRDGLLLLLLVLDGRHERSGLSSSVKLGLSCAVRRLLAIFIIRLPRTPQLFLSSSSSARFLLSAE